jgi:hypothetical protein
LQKFDHNIGFWRKTQFFHGKLAKIAENCDHNFDPQMVGSHPVDETEEFGDVEAVGSSAGSTFRAKRADLISLTSGGRK